MTTSPTPHVAPLVQSWLKLWNGDFSRAEELIAPDFRVHAALLGGGDGSALSGPQGLIQWIAQTRAVAADLTFQIEVGPPSSKVT